MLKSMDILIVDDNQEDIDLTKSLLLKNNLGNYFTAVKDGKAAVTYVRNRKPDDAPLVLLLDMHMPVMDGPQVLNELQPEIINGLKIIIMTTDDNDRYIVESYAKGIQSYIVKPVTIKTLIASMAQAGLYFNIMKRSI
jgi:CheY-like chemotaxis protein